MKETKIKEKNYIKNKINAKLIISIFFALLMVGSSFVAADSSLAKLGPHTSSNHTAVPSLKGYTYSATVDVYESGLNSNVSSWSASISGGNDPSSSASPGSELILVVGWDTSGGLSVTLSWGSVGGWGTPGTHDLSLANDGAYSETGTYSPTSFSLLEYL